MKRDGRSSELFSYLAVACFAVGLAFLVSMRFLGRAHSLANTAPPAPAAGATPTSPPPAAGPPAPGVGPNATPDATGATPVAPVVDKDSASSVAAEVQGFLEPFIYDAKNRRDPFQAFVDVRPVETQQFLSPLQRYDLDEFRLVGIMWDIHDPKAMFIDPEKQVHVVGRDESIGKRNGYIATIREGEVVVVESFRGKGGTLNFKPRVLHLER